MFFPLERTRRRPARLDASCCRRLPEEITSWASVLHFPPLPELPEAVRGQSFAVVMAAFLGSEADGRELLRAAARARPRDGHVRDAAAGRARRPGDGPARPAALPRARTRSIDELPGAAIEDIARIAGPGSALAHGPAPPHGRRPRPPRRRARARAPRCPARSACSASGVVPGAGRRAGRRRRELDAVSARRRAAPRRRLPELRRGARRTRAPSSTPTPGSACAASRRSTTRRTSSRGNHHVPPAQRS